MRGILATTAVLGALGAVGLVAACGPEQACVDYCAAVSDQLVECQLAEDGDFNLADCEDRTSAVDADVCASTTTRVRKASCDEMVDGFCPDSALHCPKDPKECFSECCADTDCSPDKPRCDSGICKACTEATQDADCPTHTCRYGECIECTPETEMVACAAGEGCDYDRCLKKCFTDTDCGPYRSCVVNFCSKPVGTPCEGGTGCGAGGSCETLNSKLETVPGYCTIICIDSDPMPCPAGYACLDYKCRP